MTKPNSRAPKRQPTFTTDENGAPIVIVPLATGQTARVDLADWEALLLRGVSPNWTRNTAVNGFAYVRARAAGQNLLMVAREILGARPREIVSHRNGDRTDLRRANLKISTGGRAKARA